MYMAPIVRAKASASPFVRRTIGGILLPLSVALMLPFLGLFALYAGGVLAVRGVVAGGLRILLDMVDYAGAAVVGD